MTLRIFHILLLPFLLIAVNAFAQKKMASPPAEATGEIEGVSIAIDYHQPSARGRKIMGELVPFGKVWRTGANNTTTIKFNDDVVIEGKKVVKGKYGLYTIPGEAEWTVILNNSMNWGAYDYKKENDILRVKVKPTKSKQFVETFSIQVEGSEVTMEWENTRVAFKVARSR